MRASKFLNCELDLTSNGQACLSVAGSEYTGHVNFDEALMSSLRAVALHSVRYGAILFEALFPSGSELLAGYGESLAVAKSQDKRLRFRLRISTAASSEVHALHWEFLYDPQRKIALSRSPATSFSRYLAVRRGPGTSVVERPRMLVALACPRDLGDYGLDELDREAMAGSLREALEPLTKEVTVEFLKPPITAVRLRKRLVSGRYHMLHIQAHGLLLAEKETASLALERDDGNTSFVEETLFAEVCEGDGSLRLVTLMACQSGSLSSADPFSGLAPALVERGIPAVIAMRRRVSIDLAARFTKHLYLSLAGHGVIDAAVNEARQQLHLEAPFDIDWGIPSLYMRLPDGRLWSPAGHTVTTEGELPIPAPTPSGLPQARHRRRRAIWAAAAMALGLVVLVALRVFHEKSDPVDVKLELAWIDDAIYTPLRDEVRRKGLTLSFTPTERDPEPRSVLDVEPGDASLFLSLLPGTYRLGTARPEVELVPERVRVDQDLPQPIPVAARFVGSTVILAKIPELTPSIVITGEVARAEIVPQAAGLVVLGGVPVGRYRIFIPASEGHQALSRELVVAHPRETYTVDLSPPAIPERISRPAPPPPPPTPPEPSADQSEANFRMLHRMVRIACADPKTEGDLSHVLPVLQGTIDGDGRMPVRQEHRQELQELLERLRNERCEGEKAWWEERQRRREER